MKKYEDDYFFLGNRNVQLVFSIKIESIGDIYICQYKCLDLSICVCTEVYYEELAYTVMETDKFKPAWCANGAEDPEKV